jgi:hypothetical protein
VHYPVISKLSLNTPKNNSPITTGYALHQTVGEPLTVHAVLVALGAEPVVLRAAARLREDALPAAAPPTAQRHLAPVPVVALLAHAPATTPPAQAMLVSHWNTTSSNLGRTDARTVSIHYQLSEILGFHPKVLISNL